MMHDSERDELIPEEQQDAVLRYHKVKGEKGKDRTGTRVAGLPLGAASGGLGAVGLAAGAATTESEAAASELPLVKNSVSFSPEQLAASVAVNGSGQLLDDPWEADDEDYPGPEAVGSDEEKRREKRKAAGPMAFRGSGVRGAKNAKSGNGAGIPMVPGASVGGVGGPGSAGAGFNPSTAMGAQGAGAAGMMSRTNFAGAPGAIHQPVSSAAYAPSRFSLAGPVAADAGDGPLDDAQIRELLQSSGFDQTNSGGSSWAAVGSDGQIRSNGSGWGAGSQSGSGSLQNSAAGTSPGGESSSSQPGQHQEDPGSKPGGDSQFWGPDDWNDGNYPGDQDEQHSGSDDGRGPAGGPDSEGGNWENGNTTEGNPGQGQVGNESNSPGDAATPGGTGSNSNPGATSAGQQNNQGSAVPNWGNSSVSSQSSSGSDYRVSTGELRHEARQWSAIAADADPVQSALLSSPEAEKMFGFMKEQIPAYHIALQTTAKTIAGAAQAADSTAEGMAQSASNYEEAEAMGVRIITGDSE